MDLKDLIKNGFVKEGGFVIDIFCNECYSSDSRITPLVKPKDCLTNHRQYVCSTCSRCMCCSVDEKGRYRAMFPFKSLEIAILYLRSVEVITGKVVVYMKLRI